jgi:hypothetical protein
MVGRTKLRFNPRGSPTWETSNARPGMSYTPAHIHPVSPGKQKCVLFPLQVSLPAAHELGLKGSSRRVTAVPGKREVGVGMGPLSAPISPLSWQRFLFPSVTVGQRAGMGQPHSLPLCLSWRCHLPLWGLCDLGQATEPLCLSFCICKMEMRKEIEPVGW